MNFQIYPLTVRINGQINGIGCGVSIFETYGCVVKYVETVGCRTKLSQYFISWIDSVDSRH